MNTRRYCFGCDLKDDPQLMEEYKEYHAAGNADLQIYLTGNRMFMIMDVDETFDPVKKAQADAKNPKVQEWEELMWKYQQALPWAKEGEKWVPMEQVFQLV